MNDKNCTYCRIISGKIEANLPDFGGKKARLKKSKLKLVKSSLIVPS